MKYLEALALSIKFLLGPRFSVACNDYADNERMILDSSFIGSTDTSFHSMRPASVHFTNLCNLENFLFFLEYYLHTITLICYLHQRPISPYTITESLLTCNYNFYHHCCWVEYEPIVTQMIPIACLMDWESPNFDAFGSKFVCLPLFFFVLPTVFLILLTLLLSSTVLPHFTRLYCAFMHLPRSSMLETKLNTHHKEWLTFSYTDSRGNELSSFSVVSIL